MSEPLLAVRDVRVKYAGSGRKPAVDGVSFDLAPGAVLGIVGESGCGKSSLARAILQLEEYDGDVRLLGRPLRRLSRGDLRRARREMQAVFQDPLASLSPRMTVGAIIEEPLRVHCPALGAAQRMDKVAAILERVGLDADLMHQYPHELSGGQCQRVGIARAVICEPKLLICDEPVSALDTSVRGQILGLLATLRRDLDIAIVFIAHDMTAVRYLCDDVLVMKEGKMIELASRETIFGTPQHEYTQRLLESVLPPDPDTQPPRDTLEMESA